MSIYNQVLLLPNMIHEFWLHRLVNLLDSTNERIRGKNVIFAFSNGILDRRLIFLDPSSVVCPTADSSFDKVPMKFKSAKNS